MHLPLFLHTFVASSVFVRSTFRYVKNVPIIPLLLTFSFLTSINVIIIIISSLFTHKVLHNVINYAMKIL